jgi:hypothetical protein
VAVEEKGGNHGRKEASMRKDGRQTKGSGVQCVLEIN